MRRGPDDEAPERILREGRVPEFVQERLLEHPIRQAIVDLLEERPGMNKNQIGQELDTNSNLLNHHLDKLETEGQLVVTCDSAQENEVLCFLTEDVNLGRDENTRILFGRRPKRKVALFLAENPGSTARQIATAVRLSPWTVRHHLRTLMSHRLVDRYSSGQTNVYEPSEALTQWVEEVGEGFERPWEG